MRFFSSLPIALLTLGLVTGACRHKPDAPLFISPAETEEAVTPRSETPAGEGKANGENGTTKEPDAVSLGTTDGAIAANPTTTNPKESTPTLDRQTVVVGNGRFEPTLSSWYRFPDDHKALNQALAYIQGFMKDPENDFKVQVVGQTKYLCLSSEKEMEIVRILFDRFMALASSDGIPAIHVTSSARCNGSSPPDFKKAKAVLPREAQTNPSFVCSATDNARSQIFVHDYLNAKGFYAADIKTLDTTSLELVSNAASPLSFSFGANSDPILQFGLDESVLDLSPYQSLGDTFVGVLRHNGEEKGETSYRCRMRYQAPF